MANLFGKLGQSLKKTRDVMLAGLFRGPGRIDAAFYEELEEAMIVADMGCATAVSLTQALRTRVAEQKLTARDEARAALAGIIAGHMRQDAPLELSPGEMAVLLVVGVNGVGKTTTIGKLARWYADRGRKPLLAAADTFRAAAVEQLSAWADRAGVPIVKSHEGADPASVVFDAIAAARSRGADLLIVDTAGRLHNKANLMQELSKIRRVIDRELPQARVECLLVLDATTGQNAILQAQAFSDAAALTGVVITKLDGSAKGGMAVAVKRQLNLPVRFVGVGEGLEDLMEFDPDSFARALLGE